MHRTLHSGTACKAGSLFLMRGRHQLDQARGAQVEGVSLLATCMPDDTASTHMPMVDCS